MERAEETRIVAKFGGTSMAYPELVAEQLNCSGNEAVVVVVSAPGTDELHTTKTTRMLEAYEAEPNDTIAADIQNRYKTIVNRIDPFSLNDEMLDIVDRIPSILREWIFEGDDAIAALGEYWSARIFAAHSGRKFIDACELIHFDADGTLLVDTSIQAIQTRLHGTKDVVVPGYYGSDPMGRVRLLDHGGSDITGALIARALNADSYHNWSDVSGFHSADPNKVSTAHLLPEVTYREARELAHGGSELLHRSVIELLGHTGIKTYMRQTTGSPNNIGTVISDERDWEHSPIASVSGRSDLYELSLHEFGLNESIGGTTDAYFMLQTEQVPYLHAATGVDDVSIFVSAKHLEPLEQIASDLSAFNRKVTTRPVGLVHVVGEGLAKSGIERSRTLGRVMLAFANEGIESFGTTDVSQSASITMFVSPDKDEVQRATRIAHDVLFA